MMEDSSHVSMHFSVADTRIPKAQKELSSLVTDDSMWQALKIFAMLQKPYPWHSKVHTQSSKTKSYIPA